MSIRRSSFFQDIQDSQEMRTFFNLANLTENDRLLSTPSRQSASATNPTPGSEGSPSAQRVVGFLREQQNLPPATFPTRVGLIPTQTGEPRTRPHSPKEEEHRHPHHENYMAPPNTEASIDELFHVEQN